jgi:hypothetical protein
MLVDKDTELYKLVLDDSTKKYIRFADIELDKFAAQGSGHSWTSSKRVLLFEFHNLPNNLSLVLTIGTGNVESVRRQIYEMSLKNLQMFKKPSYKKNGHLFIKRIP